MKNNMLFTTMSLIFVIVCIIFVVLSKENENTYVIKIESSESTFINENESSDKQIPANESGSALPETEKPVTVQENGKVNINTATLDELMTLTGIGEIIGQRIIDYRIENGTFYSIEELLEVKGIGEKSFEKIRDMIVIE